MKFKKPCSKESAGNEPDEPDEGKGMDNEDEGDEDERSK